MTSGRSHARAGRSCSDAGGDRPGGRVRRAGERAGRRAGSRLAVGRHARRLGDLRRGRRHHRHPVAAAHAQAAQRVGGPVGELLHVAEGPALVAAVVGDVAHRRSFRLVLVENVGGDVVGRRRLPSEGGGHLLVGPGMVAAVVAHDPLLGRRWRRGGRRPAAKVPAAEPSASSAVSHPEHTARHRARRHVPAGAALPPGDHDLLAPGVPCLAAPAGLPPGGWGRMEIPGNGAWRGAGAILGGRLSP